MKTLITWFGFTHDFIDKTTAANPSGFTSSIHEHIYESYQFKKHVIVCTKETDETKQKELKQKKYNLGAILETHPNHVFEFRDIDIFPKDLQQYEVIEEQLRSLLLSFDHEDEIHVIAGTGPTSVSMAWCTLNNSLERKFGLHLLKDVRKSKDKQKIELIEIKPNIKPFSDQKTREHFIGINPPKDLFTDEIVNKEYAMAAQIATAQDVNVLILGETGCGKDRMAKYIVENSPLKLKEYKAVNCASLHNELLYSELFGHEKGAFTGASDKRIGLFEECNGGTLFLDEIGDTTPYLQQSLLRALENKEIKRAGSNKIIQNVKVRIIAATNQDLYEKCKQGKFRFDLYYRLCEMEIEIKPYRFRTEKEKKQTIGYYLKKLELKWGRPLEMSAEAEKAVYEYSFPGNFREIYNTLNGLFALNFKITATQLPKRLFDKEATESENHDEVLKRHCQKVYERYGKDLKKTMLALGYQNVTQFRTKIEKWGIQLT